MHDETLYGSNILHNKYCFSNHTEINKGLEHCKNFFTITYIYMHDETLYGSNILHNKYCFSNHTEINKGLYTRICMQYIIQVKTVIYLVQVLRCVCFSETNLNEMNVL